jgi:hypothetical protein
LERVGKIKTRKGINAYSYVGLKMAAVWKNYAKLKTLAYFRFDFAIFET